MVEGWHARRSNTTNEVVIDAKHWLDNLPHSVEAMFFIEGGYSCESQIWCPRRRFAELLQRILLREYQLRPQELPLLRLDPHAHHSPFTV